MKSTFSLNAIAFGNLRQRRGQYVLLVIGIVLAIYFVATMLLFASTMFISLQERQFQRLGEQDAIIFNTRETPLSELTERGVFAEYGVAAIQGYVLPDGQNSANGFSVAVFDDVALQLARKDVLQGRLPVQAGEIALEQSMLARLRTTAAVGDTITLTLQIPDSVSFMPETIIKDYKLVGILTDKLVYLEQRGASLPAYYDYPAGVLSAAEPLTVGGKEVVNVYGRYLPDARESYTKMDTFCAEMGLLGKDGRPPYDIMHYQLFDSSYNNSDIVTTYVILIIIAIVLVAAACLGIINAFAANLEARKRQIGLLRAVGATKKQIRQIFGKEALLLSLFSIPLALVLAYLTVWGITTAMGDSFLLRPNLLILISVAAAGMLCVKLAAAIPLNTASQVPPMQAIRNVELSRKIKISKVASKKSFAVPHLLAQRSHTLYSNKQAAITAMLAVSILLISLAVLYVPSILEQATFNYGSDFLLLDYRYDDDWLMAYNFHTPGITEQDRQDTAALPTVAKVTGEKKLSVKILSNTITPYVTNLWEFEYLLAEPRHEDNSEYAEASRVFKALQHQSYLNSKEKYGYMQDYLTVSCYATEADVVQRLTPYVASGRINLDKLASGEEILLIAPPEYGLYEEQYNDGGWTRRLDYIPDPDVDYQGIYQNDMFQAGDSLSISLLYSDISEQQHADGPQQYNKDGTRQLPEDAVRVDKTVSIGAILQPLVDGKYLDSNFSFMHTEIGDILTTTTGLQALGFDVPYASLNIMLAASPDEVMEEYLTANLSGIAARTSGAEFKSYIAIARENRKMAYGIVIAVYAVLFLFFAICTSMINNALSARIRASKREIGTMRAVGASEQEIMLTYQWQLSVMFCWGTIIGMVAQLVVCTWILSIDPLWGRVRPTPPVWQPLLFVALLLGICSLSVRAKVGSIVKDSIIANIREL
ncbi:MAG TPA: FtsX-like permease family protein [Oscillospiraceae bacterium]|nr:FtsX-like permease family protein [Oscillospiraceae bacterium]